MKFGVELSARLVKLGCLELDLRQAETGGCLARSWAFFGFFPSLPRQVIWSWVPRLGFGKRRIFCNNIFSRSLPFGSLSPDLKLRELGRAGPVLGLFRKESWFGKGPKQGSVSVWCFVTWNKAAQRWVCFGKGDWLPWGRAVSEKGGWAGSGA
ncbi:unnamed protein product [Prunus armeniaca]